MTNFKKDYSNRVLTINGKRYIPFQVHKLPKYYSEIPLEDQFNFRGLTYIDRNALKSVSYEFKK